MARILILFVMIVVAPGIAVKTPKIARAETPSQSGRLVADVAACTMLLLGTVLPIAYLVSLIRDSGNKP